MKDILKLGFALMVYGIVAGLALGLVNYKTAPIIAEQARLAKEAAIEEVLPAYQAQEVRTIQVDDREIEIVIGFQTEDKTKPSGYAITAFAGGFSSTISIMTGLNPDMTINRIKIIDQNETPGLGTHCEGEPFTSQFIGKDAISVALKNDGGEIDAITGATITARAVADGVREYANILSDNLPVFEETVEDEIIEDGDEPEVIE